MAFIFFIFFALTLLGMYLSIRRQILPPQMTAGVGVAVSIVLMILYMLTSGSSIIQSLVMGVVMGLLFSGATLAIAWYFHSNELRRSGAYRQSADATHYEASAPVQAIEHEEYYE